MGKSTKQALIETYIARVAEKYLKESEEMGLDTETPETEVSELQTTIDKIKSWFENKNPKYMEKLDQIIKRITDAQASDEVKSNILKDRFEYIWTGSLDEGGLEEISLSGIKNVISKGASKLVDKGHEYADKIVDKTSQAANAVADKAKEVGNGISKEYHKGVVSDTEKKLKAQMEKVKQIVMSYNASAKKSGQPPINPRSLMGILNTIK